MHLLRPVRAVCVACVASLAGTAVLAGPTSPACRQALDALQQREARLPKRGDDKAPADVSDPRLRDARARTARICLGDEDAAPPAARSGEQRARSARRAAEGPLSVAPITAPPPAGRRPAMPEPLPPLPVPRPPTTITSCDVAGCWTSDGSRVQRMGPNLVGQGGQCVLGGNIIQCP